VTRRLSLLGLACVVNIAAGTASPARAQIAGAGFQAPDALREAGKGRPYASVERVWPDPPATARIRFVSALVPRTARRRSLLRRVWDAVAGGTDAPVMKQPYGLAVGTGGRLYVADPQSRVIHV
jgi:hypothetical protein